MAEDAERHRLRATFDQGAQRYEDGRPVAPAFVLDDLAALAKLVPGARLLEIGCGTGQVTLALAERGFAILAVELGESMAELARRKLADFPHVEIVTSTFEDWDPKGARFDAVVSFNAFHWLDPDVRFSKSASVLHPGGALGVMGMGIVDHDDADPVWRGLAEEYEGAASEIEPWRRLDSMRDRSDEFVAGGWYESVERRTYVWETEYDAEAYVAFLETTSAYRVLADDVRDELFARIERRIAANGGTVRTTWAASLYVATTSA
jgi:cyclopropane fatty-acyl-phospholipid synthase-like methyltransferase